MKPNFNCGESELYSVSKIGWKSNLEYLQQFTNFKAKYDAAFNANKVLEVKATQLLPNLDARYAQAEKFRITLAATNTQLCDGFQSLKLYITDAYAPEYHNVNFKEAGQNLYEKAANANWDKSAELAAAMVEYIDKHLADLTANLNMPTGFQNTIEDLQTQFETDYQNFTDETEAAKVATQKKVTDSNTVYSGLISMFKDGQRIFKDNPAVRDQFTFETDLGIVTNTQASIKALIQEETTLLPIADAIITINPGDTTLTTDLTGQANAIIAEGTYDVSIEHPLYSPKRIFGFIVNKGQGNALKEKLTPTS